MLRLVLLADPAGEHPSVTRVRTAAASLAEGRGTDVSEIAMDGDDPAAAAGRGGAAAGLRLGVPRDRVRDRPARDRGDQGPARPRGTSRCSSPMKAVIAALAANLGIAITKFAAFLVTGSASMLAESVHSVADTGNELLLLVGSGRSRRARTELHPFGFGRERYFYAFVVAVLLFTVGAVFSIYDGVHKILVARGGASRRRSRSSCSPCAPCSSRSRCAPRSGKRTGSAGGWAGGTSCTPRSHRNCPSSCSRTWPRCSASGSRFSACCCPC